MSDYCVRFPWGGNKDSGLEWAAFVRLPTVSAQTATPSVLLTFLIAVTRILDRKQSKGSKFVLSHS